MNPTSTAMYDWMHILFVHGVAGVNMGQVMWQLRGHGVTYANLHDYLQGFQWPRFIKTVSGKDTCTPKRAKSCWSDVMFKATASEFLSVLPVLANYITEFMYSDPAPVDFAKGVSANFLQLVAVVELILKSSRCVVQPRQLQQAIREYLHGYAMIHGTESMIIKFHYLLHHIILIFRLFTFVNNIRIK